MFYASLYIEFISQSQEDLQITIEVSNSKTIEYRFVKLFFNNLSLYYKVLTSNSIPYKKLIENIEVNISIF